MEMRIDTVLNSIVKSAMATWGEGLLSLSKRSVALQSDPKHMEMRNFLVSHGHEERLQSKADLRKDETARKSSWTEAERLTAAMNAIDAEEDHDPTYMNSTDNVAGRIEWRV